MEFLFVFAIFIGLPIVVVAWLIELLKRDPPQREFEDSEVLGFGGGDPPPLADESVRHTTTSFESDDFYVTIPRKKELASGEPPPPREPLMLPEARCPYCGHRSPSASRCDNCGASL